MAKKTKILLITNLYPNPQEPNRGIFVESMARPLNEYCDITIVSPLPWFPRLGFLRGLKGWYRFSQVPHTYELNGQEIICPKYLAIPNVGFLHGLFLFIAIWPLIKRLQRQRHFDLINTHWLFPDGVAAAWAAKRLRLPLILSAHGTDINLYLKMRLRAPQIIAALNMAAGITVVSRQHMQKLSELGVDPEKITIIGNGFDQAFAIGDRMSSRVDLGIDINKRIIMFIGRLVPVKGLNYLLAAIAKILERDRDCLELAVIGDGPLRGEYEREIGRLGLGKSIKLYGEKKHSEIGRWMAAADIICLPSVSEGCPTIVIEALACGRPVAAAKVGDVPYLINNDNGVLFESKNVEQMIKAIQEALDKNWNEQAIRDSVADMTWSKVSGKYERAYQEAMARC